MFIGKHLMVQGRQTQGTNKGGSRVPRSTLSSTLHNVNHMQGKCSFMINSIALWSKVLEELKGIRRDLAGKRNRKNSTSESSSENNDDRKQKSKRSRKHSATETSSYDSDKETYRSKRRNRKSERNCSRSRQPPQDVDKKMLLEVMQTLRQNSPTKWQ